VIISYTVLSDISLNGIMSYILDHVNAPLTISCVQAKCLCE